MTLEIIGLLDIPINSNSGGNSSVEIVNNLTTGGANKALSAEMGKELGEKIAILYKVAVSGFGGANYKKGATPTHTFNWNVTVNGSSVEPSTQSLLIGSESPITLQSSLRSYSVSPTTNTTYKLTVDGVSKTASIKFYAPTYLGLTAASFSSTPTETAVLSVAQLTVYGPTTQNRTFSSSDTTNKLCIAAPAGMAATIKDTFGSDVTTASFTKSTVTIDGESYNVYVLTHAASLNGVKYSITIQ